MMANDYSELLVVVIIYNLDVRKCSSLISLNANSGYLDVVVYDNSLNNINNNKFDDFTYLNIKYIHNPNNPGVSKGYNFAAQYALKKNKPFLLLLDQDTYLPVDALNKYLAAARFNNEIALFAPFLNFNDKIYSPCNYFMHKGFHKHIFKLGINNLKNINFLNSGLLIRVDAFNIAGGYDENIRLYFSDFEFINRFKTHYKKYFLLDLTCLHELASADKSDLNKALERFEMYCSDGRNASKSFLLKFQYFITVGLRAIKLSVYFKNSMFIKVFYTFFL